jgi:LemA protein
VIGFLIVVLVITAGVVLLVAVVLYNGMVRLRNLVHESWRQVDVELRRRHDLIPTLVQTVQGYVQHERQVLEWVAHARAAAVAPGSGPAAQAAQEGVLAQALGRMMYVAESQPALRASGHFLHLQRELVNTEDRIAAGRRFYNANVRLLNIKTETFPSNVLASLCSITRAEYFELDDAHMRSVPQAWSQQGGPARWG